VRTLASVNLHDSGHMRQLGEIEISLGIPQVVGKVPERSVLEVRRGEFSIDIPLVDILHLFQEVVK